MRSNQHCYHCRYIITKHALTMFARFFFCSNMKSHTIILAIISLHSFMVMRRHTVFSFKWLYYFFVLCLIYNHKFILNDNPSIICTKPVYLVKIIVGVIVRGGWKVIFCWCCFNSAIGCGLRADHFLWIFALLLALTMVLLFLLVSFASEWYRWQIQ